MGRRTFVKTLVLLSALALVAAACGGGGGGGTNAGTPKKGGSIVVGAEQWPDCVNPITTCASSYWTGLQFWNVLPRFVEFDKDGNPKAGAVAADLPTQANGGVKLDPLTITYHIKPTAVWSDGTPITSKDVDFSWKADLNTPGAYATAGYTSIQSINTTDPHTAVVHFKEGYADWYDLFGGNSFGLLEAAAFPKANKDKPNLSREMSHGIPFSGGPWIMQSFSTTQSVFVRNPKFWGHQPLLDKMTWVPRSPQTTEVAGILSGELSVVYPQPTNVAFTKSLASQPNAKVLVTRGDFMEALWFNNADSVTKEDAVREALMYAVDRTEIIDGLIHLNYPQGTVLNCGPFSFPGLGPWCNITPWDKYTYKPAKSLSILKAAGWKCDSVPAKPCSKGSKTLDISYRFCNGNLRRGTTFDLIKDKVHAAGFDFHVVTKGSDCGSPLFTDTLPKGKFQVADYAQGPIAYDPTPTGNFACDQVPTAPSYGGSNYTFWCDHNATTLMKKSDAEPDQTKRIGILDQVWNAMEQQHVLLPTYVLPSVTIWRADKIAGPVGDETNNPLGTFVNSDQWYLK